MLLQLWQIRSNYAQCIELQQGSTLSCRVLNLLSSAIQQAVDLFLQAVY
jgi:hypothetical protein